MGFRWALLGFVWSLVAYAESSPLEARYETALTLRKQGRDAEALVVLRSIDSELPTGRSRAQIALAEQAVGQWSEAERDLVDALSRTDAWVTQRKAALESSLVSIREHVGTLEIVTDGKAIESCGALQLLVDGSPRTDFPASRRLRVTIGNHAVELRAEHCLPVQRPVFLTADALSREVFTLVSRVTLAAEPATQSAARPVDPSASNTSSGLRVLGFASMGLGGAAGTLALASALISNGHVRAYNADPSCELPDKSAACVDERSSATTWRTVAWVSGIAGGALLATGLVFVLTSGSSSKRLTVGPTHVALSGTF